MIFRKEGEPIKNCLTYFPAGMREEIERFLRTRRDVSLLSEIRLRADSKSYLVFGGENCFLQASLSCAELTDVLHKICGGSLYAYRDSIADGYIGMEGGMRVGVIGHARYEEGKIVGVSDVTSLVFRFPGMQCDCLGDLLAAWRACDGGGLLIFSPPGTGKTTALRALTHCLGSGKRGLRICVVDERCEFSPADYAGTAVDILRGYRRADGIEIATRTLNPQVIAVDEIGNPEEAGRMVGVLGGGIPLVATAHAGSADELFGRACLHEFFRAGIFRVYAELACHDGRYSCHYDRIGDMKCVSS